MYKMLDDFYFVLFLGIVITKKYRNQPTDLIVTSESYISFSSINTMYYDAIQVSATMQIMSYDRHGTKCPTLDKQYLFNLCNLDKIEDDKHV